MRGSGIGGWLSALLVAAVAVGLAGCATVYNLPGNVPLGTAAAETNGVRDIQAYEDDRPFPHRMEMGSPHARYAFVTRIGSEWTVEFRAIEYDWDAASATAKANGRHDWAVALRSGRCRDSELVEKV